MRYIWHKNLSVAVFTPQQRAILQASQSDPWKVGEGTAPVLSMAALKKMHCCQQQDILFAVLEFTFMDIARI